MLAITLSEARSIAVALVIAFAAAAVLALWILKSIAQKVIVVGVLALLGFAVWTQRASLQDCADKVIAAYASDGVDANIVGTQCSFFGMTITITDPRTPQTEQPDVAE